MRQSPRNTLNNLTDLTNILYYYVTDMDLRHRIIVFYYLRIKKHLVESRHNYYNYTIRYKNYSYYLNKLLIKQIYLIIKFNAIEK